MTPATDQNPSQTLSETDLGAEVQRVLGASPEPLTLSKIRSSLPARLRSVELEPLAEVLRRQVAANVLVQYPKYRSQQDRFWDRPMPVHVAYLLRLTLEETPLAWSELRRKLPDYAKAPAEAVLEDQVTQGLLHRHPPTSSRSGARFGVQRPDAREYLRAELTAAFSRLEKLGFSQAQLREGALELLHEEEWATPPGRTPEQTPAGSEQPRERRQAPAAATPAGQSPAQPKASHGPQEHQGPHGTRTETQPKPAAPGEQPS
jgi:hypothetical protein